MALIECRELALSYDGKMAVSGLNFTVERGDYLCISGENGSGKSTLIKGILGLKEPYSGKIIFGEGLNKNQIGYLPQQSPVQRNFPAHVNEIVLSGCVNKLGIFPFFSSKMRKRAEMNMERMNIRDIERSCYRELSGGQQQRVLLARALCATETLLLLDEPSAGLDPLVTAEFYSLLHQLNKDGLTIIMVTHDGKCITDYATMVLQLHNKQVYFGTKEDYINSEIGKEFLGGGHDHADLH